MPAQSAHTHGVDWSSSGHHNLTAASVDCLLGAAAGSRSLAFLASCDVRAAAVMLPPGRVGAESTALLPGETSLLYPVTSGDCDPSEGDSIPTGIKHCNPPLIGCKLTSHSRHTPSVVQSERAGAGRHPVRSGPPSPAASDPLHDSGTEDMLSFLLQAEETQDRRYELTKTDRVGVWRFY